jgi:hypothetical protein
MTAHITAAQARAAGIDVPAAKKKRSTRRTVKGAPYHTVCKACGFESRTQAAEDRHLDENPGHCRYELVLGL